MLTLTTRLGLRSLPFALLAVWLANTASLLLPVSNLTNLLALQREHLSTLHFAARMVGPEIVAVAVTERIGILTARHARELGQADRVILGTDGPAGSGVPPLGMLRLIALLSSMADIPGVSMVLIDGVVRCHRSRNTPPAVEVPVLVG